MDEHLGLAIAGLTSDARVLSNFMKQQCLSQRLTYDRAMPVETLVSLIGDKAQTNTQHYGKRPYGVGLLVAGVDEAGPHLFEFQPFDTRFKGCFPVVGSGEFHRFTGCLWLLRLTSQHFA